MNLEKRVQSLLRPLKKTAAVALLSALSWATMGVSVEALRDLTLLSGTFATSRVIKEYHIAKEENRFPRYGKEAMKGVVFGGLLTPFIHHSYGLMNTYAPVDTIPQSLDTGEFSFDKAVKRTALNAGIYPALGSVYAAPADHIAEEGSTKGITTSLKKIPQLMKSLYLTAPLMLLNVFFANPLLHVPIAALIGFLVDYKGIKKSKSQSSYAPQPAPA